jgi:ABC-2 type transport system ATP-binding protein
MYPSSRSLGSGNWGLAINTGSRLYSRVGGNDGCHVIEVAGLTKRYGDFTALEGLSFTVRPGEVLGLVGPNGAGKTSTLRCVAGIIPPNQGSVHIDGIDLAENPVGAKARLAFFSDEPRLFDYLTVRQHLAFVARIYGVANHEALAEPLLEELELAPKANELPGALSRGMKRKLAIACGFLHSPRAIFFDEPLTGLDPLGIRRMKDSIRRRAVEGAAIVLSSHLLHLLEEVCSHVLILQGGRKIADGTVGEITARFGGGQDDVDLEEVFLRATGGSAPPPAPPAVPAEGPPPLPPP